MKTGACPYVNTVVFIKHKIYVYYSVYRKYVCMFINCVHLQLIDHGIRPITTGLVAVLLLFGPRLGPVPFDALRQKFNFPVLVYVASVMALAPLLVSTPSAGSDG